MQHHHEANHTQHEQQPSAGYSFKDFLPLIIIFAIIVGLTIFRQATGDWNMMTAMQDFMGFFFVIFGGFKLLNWSGFVEAYRTYDIVAKRSVAYAYAYPLIEIGLGIAYLTGFMPVATNVVTLVVMLISSIGVAQELAQKRQIMCACLGVVFKIPMTYVTLLEDLLMAAMALVMLFAHLS